MLRDLGVMLPCSGLHLLIMQQFNRPMVASGNMYGEPMVSTSSAQQHLTMLADIFVHHNRDIFHKLDDSVLRTLKTPFNSPGAGYKSDRIIIAIYCAGTNACCWRESEKYSRNGFEQSTYRNTAYWRPRSPISSAL